MNDRDQTPGGGRAIHDVWQVSDTIARELVKRDCDPSELHKALTYLRTHADGDLFFRFLDATIKHGRSLARTRRTLDYYRDIQEVCLKHLSSDRADPTKMALILGWATRLMRYYAARRSGPGYSVRGHQVGRQQH